MDEFKIATTKAKRKDPVSMIYNHLGHHRGKILCFHNNVSQQVLRVS